jgi:hypothetical protein
MPEYIVYTKEIVLQPIKVEAENAEEAIEAVRDGLGECLEREALEVVDSDDWKVVKIGGPGQWDEFVERGTDD